MKNTRSKLTKLAVAVAAVTCLLLVPQTLFAAKVEGAVKNKDAHAAYEKQIKYYKRLGYRDITYKYADITGNKVDEAVVRYTGKKGDNKQYLRILGYSGKINRLLLYKDSPTMQKLLVYKKTDSFILYSTKAGSESYTYFTIVGSKYAKVASKTRVTGTQKKQDWKYYDSEGNKIAQDRFKAITSPLKKGTKTRVKLG
jgi:hypothetical protein